MQLTHHTDLALRVLIYLAVQRERESLVTMAEIARFYRASHEHLRKVVYRLSKLDFVVAKQGRNGGLRLAQPARSIDVAAVIRAMENDLTIVNCQALDCVLTGPCSLKHALSEARAAFMQVLSRYSLADLIADRSTAKRLVQVMALRVA